MRWMRQWRRRLRGRRGFSVIEVLVAVAVFAFAIMAMATSSGLISKQMKIARRDMRLAFAMQHKMEEILSWGYAGMVSGNETVAGFPMTWTVVGTNPKTVTLVAQYSTNGTTRRDTIITQVAQPSP